MIRILKFAAAVALALLAAAVLSYYLVNPEPRRLDAQARANAPGTVVALGDGLVRYELTGAAGGRTLVLIHGAGPNSCEALAPLAAALARADYRVLRFDLYGQGYSDRPRVVFNFDLFDRQIEQLLSKLGVAAPIDLVGFSMGSWIAAGYAARHPERVRSLTLVGAPGPGGNASFSLKLAAYPLIGEYLFRVFGRKIVERGLTTMRHAPKYVEHCLHDEMPLTEFEGTRRAALSVLRNTPSAANIYERVGLQGLPVLAIYGQYDLVAPPSQVAKLKQLIPRLEVRQVANASHGGLVYDNAEEVAGHIVNSLRTSP